MIVRMAGADGSVRAIAIAAEASSTSLSATGDPRVIAGTLETDGFHGRKLAGMSFSHRLPVPCEPIERFQGALAPGRRIKVQARSFLHRDEHRQRLAVALDEEPLAS